MWAFLAEGQHVGNATHRLNGHLGIAEVTGRDGAVRYFRQVRGDKSDYKMYRELRHGYFM